MISMVVMTVRFPDSALLMPKKAPSFKQQFLFYFSDVKMEPNSEFPKSFKMGFSCTKAKICNLFGAHACGRKKDHVHH